MADSALDDREYQLPINDGPNHLHGGPNGFHTREWRVAEFHRDAASGAVLCRRSVDGEDGYPGTLITRVTYTLRDDDTFRVDYSAVTDAPTVVNLTQHTYFNLRGHDRGDILGHELTVNATYFTPVDATAIPSGALRGVIGTAFDFTSPRTIGGRIDEDDEQLRFVGGYDHNFQLRRSDARELVTAAHLHDPESGRFVEIATTEPGLQVYSSNTIGAGGLGKGGHRYEKHAAIALETQHFPDSPNQPGSSSVDDPAPGRGARVVDDLSLWSCRFALIVWPYLDGRDRFQNSSTLNGAHGQHTKTSSESNEACRSRR